MSFLRCSSQPISWDSTVETKRNATKANKQNSLSLTRKTKCKYTTTQKLNLNLNQHLSLRTAHMCVHHCAQLSSTTQHRTVLIIFPLILQPIIIAQISTGEGAKLHTNQHAENAN